MNTELWASSNDYFQSTQTFPFWQVQYPTEIFIRKVVLFAARGSSLQGIEVRVKKATDADVAS